MITATNVVPIETSSKLMRVTAPMKATVPTRRLRKWYRSQLELL